MIVSPAVPVNRYRSAKLRARCGERQSPGAKLPATDVSAATSVVGHTTRNDTRIRSGEFLAPTLVSTTVSEYNPSTSPAALATSRIESRPRAGSVSVSGVTVSHVALAAMRAFTPSVTVPVSRIRRNVVSA